ncbi:uncharacterized protein [Littorina saxatilis]|uniref:uncharacterized protein n=1 Tax=Littorina saxatilis TaxID=31220 RepID=UPI0038B54391
MFKTRGLNLPEEQKKAVTSTEDEYKRMHVQGPPGSGRTTMLICKAMMCLRKGAGGAASRLSNVVVLDMYRGLKGRPIGIHIKNAIRDADEEAFDGRVHHLPIDVLDNQESFVQQVEDLFEGTKPKWKDVLFIIDEMLPLSYWRGFFKAFQNEFKDSHVWCADGLIAQELDDAPEFKHLQLEHIYRLPGSVQKVMYHADWDEKRKQQYLSDVKRDAASSASTQQAAQLKKTRASGETPQSREQPGQSSADRTPRLNVCTHGPTAVCIKHQHRASNKALLDCVQCAEELIDLLINKMKLVENETHSSTKKSVVGEKAQAATLQAKPDEGHGQAASSDMDVDEEDNPGAVAGPSLFLPCSIVIVFSIPSNLYQASTQGSDHVEINKEDYEDYVAKLNDSQFISTLRKALPVQLFSGTTGPGEEQNQDPDCQDNWDKVLLSWVDIFQGLERDVVIFLPGETAFQTEESSGSSLQVPEISTMNIRDPPSPRKEKKSPASSPRSMSRNRSQDPQPSTRTEKEVTGRSTGKRPAAAARIHERKIPEPGLAIRTSQQPVSSRTRRALPDTTAATAAATEKGMSSYYWRVRDIQRYTEWDKTSLMFAATRCTSQLIMLVP